MEQKLNRLLLPVFLVYACCVLYGVIIHESWGDEAQPWLLVRDSSLTGLLKLLPNEGHPPLWYLLIMPFAKLGAPYEIIKWISGLAVIGGIYLFLFKTNYPLLLKIVFPFSNFIIYKYSVFARSYSIMILLLMAVLALYPQRFKKPWWFALCIVGLFNTHMLVFPFTFSLLMLYIIDAIEQKQWNSKTIGATILMCIGGLYLIPYLVNSEMAAYFQHIAKPDHLNTFNKLITGGLLISGNTMLAMALFIGICFLLVDRTKAIFALICGVTGIVYIIVFRYSVAMTRHFGVLYIVMVGAYGLADAYKNDRFNLRIKPQLSMYGAWVCALVAVLQIEPGFRNYGYDINNQYSGSKEAAAYLMDNNLEHHILVGYQSWAAISVLPYLPKDVSFYNPRCDRSETYFVYDTCFTKAWNISNSYVVKIAYQKFKDRIHDVILVLNFPVTEQAGQYLDLLYTNEDDPVYSSEHFFIYKFKDFVH